MVQGTSETLAHRSVNFESTKPCARVGRRGIQTMFLSLIGKGYTLFTVIPVLILYLKFRFNFNWIPGLAISRNFLCLGNIFRNELNSPLVPVAPRPLVVVVRPTPVATTVEEVAEKLRLGHGHGHGRRHQQKERQVSHSCFNSVLLSLSQHFTSYT